MSQLDPVLRLKEVVVDVVGLQDVGGDVGLDVGLDVVGLDLTKLEKVR